MHIYTSARQHGPRSLVSVEPLYILFWSSQTHALPIWLFGKDSPRISQAVEALKKVVVHHCLLTQSKLKQQAQLKGVT